MGLALMIVRKTEDDIDYENDEIWQSSYSSWLNFLYEIDNFLRMKELEKNDVEQLKGTKLNIDNLVIVRGKYPEFDCIILPKLQEENTTYYNLAKTDVDVLELFESDDDEYWSTEKCKVILDFLETLPENAPIDRRRFRLQKGLETCVKEGYRVLHC